MKQISICLIIVLLISAVIPAYADTVIDLSGEKYETSEQTAVVTVGDEVINTVKSGIFGANTSYRGGGYGIYDEEELTFNETLLEQIRNSGVTHLRLPGGIEGDYIHWNECIGPLEERKEQIDCFSSEYPTYTLKNGAEYVVVFGPDEWNELCEKTGTALTVQLNAGNGTPGEAADYVRYCLDSGVEIESITVGNEVCMSGENVAGMHVTKTAEEYIAFYNEVWNLLDDKTKQELKDRNIPFGCIGIPASHPLCKDSRWDKTVLKEIGDKTDFIDIHIAYSPYSVNGNNNEQIIKCLLASADRVRKHLDVEIADIERFAPDVKIAISEHGPLGAIPYSSGVAGGLFLASFFQVVLAEEKVISADYLPLTNHPAANNLLGFYNETGEEITFDNVVSFVFRMYAEQIGRDVLICDVSGAKTFAAPAVGLMAGIRGVSEGASAVYYDAKTGEGSLFLINKAYKENTVFNVDLPFDEYDISGITELYTYNNTMYNSYTRPTMVKPIDHSDLCTSVGNETLTVTLKPVSLLKIDFKVAK